MRNDPLKEGKNMNTAIYHPGNAGLYFYGRGTGILVDGIYGGRGVGMSEMNEAWERVLPNGMIAICRSALFPALRHMAYFQELYTVHFTM